MNFKDYESRPITRRAYQIQPSDKIIYDPDNSQATVGDVTFKCYQVPVAGDYICHLSEDDIYHVSEDVFVARNIVGRNTSAIETGDQLAAKVQVTPNRVTLDDMKAKVVDVEYINPSLIPHMTLATVMLSNGFCLVGRSTPADPDNFDSELGKKFAFDDAIRQMWPLEGYALREKLTTSE